MPEVYRVAVPDAEALTFPPADVEAVRRHGILRIDPPANADLAGLSRAALRLLGKRPSATVHHGHEVRNVARVARAWILGTGIADVIVTRAHTLRPGVSSAFRAIWEPVDTATRLWFLDGSDAPPPGTETSPTGARGQLELQQQRLELKTRLRNACAHQPGTESLRPSGPLARLEQIEVPDAHPALLPSVLARSLPNDAARLAVCRVHLATAYLSTLTDLSPHYGQPIWPQVVRALLARAAGPTDARLLLRGCQLQALRRGVHLDLRSDAWTAAQDARREAALVSSAAAFYPDPLAAVAVGLTATTGLGPFDVALMGPGSPSLTLLAGDGFRTEPVLDDSPRHFERLTQRLFDANTGTALRALAALVGHSSDRQYLRRETTGHHGAYAVRVTGSRVAAILQHVHLETGIDARTPHWSHEHGLRLRPL